MVAAAYTVSTYQEGEDISNTNHNLSLNILWVAVLGLVEWTSHNDFNNHTVDDIEGITPLTAGKLQQPA